MRKFTVEISKATNCICNICHRDGRVAKIKYYTQDYGSNKRKGKICKTLQKHPHEIWMCEKCMEDFKSEWISSTRGAGYNYHRYYGEGGIYDDHVGEPNA